MGGLRLAAVVQEIFVRLRYIRQKQKESTPQRAAVELAGLARWNAANDRKTPWRGRPERAYPAVGLFAVCNVWQQRQKDNRQRSLRLQVVHGNALKRNNWYGTIKCYHYIKAFSEQRGIAMVNSHAQTEHTKGARGNARGRQGGQRRVTIRSRFRRANKF